MADYEQWMRVERRSDAGPGTQDPDTGVFTRPSGGVATVVYEDLADVQPSSRILARDDTGTPVLSADAQAFLADESLIGEIEEGDVAMIWEDIRAGEDTDALDATVAQVDRLTGRVYLRHL